MIRRYDYDNVFVPNMSRHHERFLAKGLEEVGTVEPAEGVRLLSERPSAKAGTMLEY